MEAPLTVATKKTRFSRDIPLPVATVREVVASERYLLTMEGSEIDPGTMVLSESELEVRDDGSVYARAVAGQTAPDGNDGNDGADGADGADGGAAPVVMEQTSEISAADADGAFTMDSSVPLPRGIGAMRTLQRFEASPDAATTLVTTEVTVEVGLPVVGGKIARKLIDGVEPSTDRSLRRIEVLAGS
jgi:hypothetical protein